LTDKKLVVTVKLIELEACCNRQSICTSANLQDIGWHCCQAPINFLLLLGTTTSQVVCVSSPANLTFSFLVVTLKFIVILGCRISRIRNSFVTVLDLVVTVEIWIDGVNPDH